MTENDYFNEFLNLFGDMFVNFLYQTLQFFPFFLKSLDFIKKEMLDNIYYKFMIK